MWAKRLRSGKALPAWRWWRKQRIDENEQNSDCCWSLARVSNPALTEETSATYAQIESEIGCQGKATDMKKDLIFNTKYRGRWVTWTGIVHDVKDGAIWFKAIGSHSIGSDFDVKMAPSVDLMQFDKDQTVTVRFQIKNYMGCILPLRGTDGTIVNNRG